MQCPRPSTALRFESRRQKIYLLCVELIPNGRKKLTNLFQLPKKVTNLFQMGVSNLFRLPQKASFDELIPIGVDELIPIGVDELIPMAVSDLFSRPDRSPLKNNSPPPLKFDPWSKTIKTSCRILGICYVSPVIPIIPLFHSQTNALCKCQEKKFWRNIHFFKLSHNKVRYWQYSVDCLCPWPSM
jgi:hypothetical protein